MGLQSFACFHGNVRCLFSIIPLIVTCKPACHGRRNVCATAPSPTEGNKENNSNKRSYRCKSYESSVVMPLAGLGTGPNAWSSSMCFEQIL